MLMAARTGRSWHFMSMGMDLDMLLKPVLMPELNWYTSAQTTYLTVQKMNI
jgi:hypothetical protein